MSVRPQFQLEKSLRPAARQHALVAPLICLCVWIIIGQISLEGNHYSYWNFLFIVEQQYCVFLNQR